MTSRMLRVTAPHFVAGIEIGDVKGKTVCTRAAPILRWTQWKSLETITAYFDRKGWAYEFLPG